MVIQYVSYFIGRETIGCAEKLVPSRSMMILGFFSIQFRLVIGFDWTLPTTKFGVSDLFVTFLFF